MSSAFCPVCGAEYTESVVECPDCYVALVGADDRAAVVPGREEEFGDEVVYELDDWEPELLDELNATLAREGIPHSWEGNRNLVVREADGDRVDELLDEIEYPDELAADDAGDEEEADEADEARYATISDLFVAADRLMHAPEDAALAGSLVHAALAIEATPPPYGFVPEEWARIRGLAAAVRHDLAGDAEPDIVAKDARSLREVLRRYV